jgi:pyruvate-formate lyase-activating enzyme
MNESGYDNSDTSETLINKWPLPDSPGSISPSDGRTNVYHIAYAEDIKKAYLFHWGCNLRCQGCLCQKEINCLALEENLDTVFRNPRLRPPQIPEHLLTFDELTDVLKDVILDEVAFEGQEASIDPWLPEICRWLKKDKNNCRTILHTNGVHYIDTKYIDDVIISIKAASPDIYLEYTSMPNRYTQENLKKYFDAGVNLKAESVFIPGYIDIEETVKIAQLIASVDKEISYRIDAYFESGDNDWRHPTCEEMKVAVDAAKKYLKNVYSTQQTKRELTKEDLLYEVVRLY